MSGRSSPFRLGVVAGVLIVGAAAFMLMLYALGQGWTGDNAPDGGAHARSNAITGFTGLVRLLDETDRAVEVTASPGRFDEYSLLVLTPAHSADAEELNEILFERRFVGPTMVILPKWVAARIPDGANVESEPGWVMLNGIVSPTWFTQLPQAKDMALATGESESWSGFDDTGSLPEPARMQAVRDNANTPLEALVYDSENDLLIADYYAGGDAWPITYVFEPDLLNNRGMADIERARMAMSLFDYAGDYENMPIHFDVSLVGLGGSENLLTLAFAPPFLAATLCLLLAALVIGWRGFRRFGPSAQATPAFAQGKRQLAQNGAALVARVKRWHLLAEPYAALVTARTAKMLGIRATGEAAQIAAIDAALARTGREDAPYAAAAQTLRDARHPRDILRAADALRTLERTLKP